MTISLGDVASIESGRELASRDVSGPNFARDLTSVSVSLT